MIAKSTCYYFFFNYAYNLSSYRKKSIQKNSNLYLIKFWILEYCVLSNDINDYYIVSQGKTVIPNVDDGEEFQLTDVRHRREHII